MNLGELIINAVIDSGAIDEVPGGVVKWAANSPEQIEAALAALLKQYPSIARELELLCALC